MFDASLRRRIEPLLQALTDPLWRLGVSADSVTWAGFGIGLGALPLLAAGHYGWALAAILVNRVLDGVDGTLARRAGPSDAGGFLDIVLDFLFYSGVVFGFALADPGNRLAAAFLIFSYVGTGSSFLAYALFADRRGQSSDLDRTKSFYYLGGLTEGTETFAVMVLMCLFPSAFPVLAWGFGALCWLTTLTRILAGWRDFR